MLTHRSDEALDLAHAWHRDQKRKGTQIPYVGHLLAVSALVLEHGGTEEEAVAGLLHDALEDAPAQEEAIARRGEIRHRFGEGVLSIVEACMDAEPAGKARERTLEPEAKTVAYRARKTRYVEHLAEAPGSVLLVAAADKVHNAGAIVRDLTLWYYRAVLAGLEARVGEEPRIAGLVRELGRLVRDRGRRPLHPPRQESLPLRARHRRTFSRWRSTASTFMGMHSSGWATLRTEMSSSMRGQRTARPPWMTSHVARSSSVAAERIGNRSRDVVATVPSSRRRTRLLLVTSTPITRGRLVEVLMPGLQELLALLSDDALDSAPL
jgi:hypothetical protein